MSSGAFKKGGEKRKRDDRGGRKKDDRGGKKKDDKGAKKKEDREPVAKKDYKSGRGPRFSKFSDNSTTTQNTQKFRVSVNDIANAQKRQQVYGDLKRTKIKQKMFDRKARQAEREALGDAAPKPFIKSIDKMREPELSIVDPEDAEVMEDTENDEFAKYFKDGIAPKVAITTAQNSSKASKEFVCNMQDLIPGLTYFRRRDFPIKKIVKYLKNRGFTDMILVGENRKKIDSFMIVHLPNGPTATFKLTSVKYPEQIVDRGIMSAHNPELILNNFTTRMGHGLGRMFASLFPQVPEFTGRRIITFHNQRDFIFVRHHRYIFEPDKEQKLKPRIQELGPRMTLKLVRLQHGTFDTMEGEFEWFMTNRMYVSSKKFYM